MCSESAVLLPVHRPVPLCAKSAYFDATLPGVWTGRSTEQGYFVAAVGFEPACRASPAVSCAKVRPLSALCKSLQCLQRFGIQRNIYRRRWR